MKNKIGAVCVIFVLAGVALGSLLFAAYLLIRLGNDFWQIFHNPERLAKMLRELSESIGGLGLCCIGIIVVGFLFGFITTKIPPSWIGLRESNDDDYWYHGL